MEQNVLAIIPARGNSKGIPKKNIRLLNGKPLIQYAIDSAKDCSYVNKIVVSTDDDEISNISLQLGADVVMRPPHLATDTSLVIDAIRYTIHQLESIQSYTPEIIVLLECTSPIKDTKDNNLAIKKLIAKEADSVATFKETSISPNRLWTIEKGKVSPFISNASPFLPRQSQPKSYELTGQLYAFTNEILKNNPTSISVLLGKVFPIISNVMSIDIDNELDLIIAEQIMKYLENEKIKGTF